MSSDYELRQVELQELKRDALRWRALMSSQRITYMGSSGFEWKETEPTENGRKFTDKSYAVPRPDNRGLHFTLNFWDVHGAYGLPEFANEDRMARTILTSYVDDIIKRSCG